MTFSKVILVFTCSKPTFDFVTHKVADNTVLREDPNSIDNDLLVEAKAREIVFQLATYSDAVRTALLDSTHSIIVSYSFKRVFFTRDRNYPADSYSFPG